MLPSAFEVLGPIMVGPSSSHTAGALRIALAARELAPAPVTAVTFTLYNSFARTYRGHGTDKALVAGMLGLATDDERIRDSFALAKDAGLAFSFEVRPDGVGLHPNTVDIAMTFEGGGHLTVRGESVGGGRMRLSAIDGVPVDVQGEYPTLFVRHQDRPGMLAALTGALSAQNINIATIRTFRDTRGGDAYTVVEVDDALPQALLAYVRSIPGVGFATDIAIPGAGPHLGSDVPACDFRNGTELLDLCQAENRSIGNAMRTREAALEGSEEDVDAAMARVLAAMEHEVRATIEEPRRSLGGLLHGQARAVSEKSTALQGALLGPALSQATAYAMATLELSSSMGVIVAAPTAGSSGVVPGALIACAEAVGAESRLPGALWCSAAIGAIISGNATVSGAEGGCQAEVGAAAAMAAAGLCQMLYGSPETCLNAAAIAIANMLGLVCDPAGGLVEFPCQDRNAAGVATAFTAAQLALSGVKSVATFDDAVTALATVGRSMPAALRETALGGLAVTPSVCLACEQPCA